MTVARRVVFVVACTLLRVLHASAGLVEHVHARRVHVPTSLLALCVTKSFTPSIALMSERERERAREIEEGGGGGQSN